MYTELKNILQYIIDKLNQYELNKLYSQLAQLYEQARTTPSEAVTTEIEKIKSEIITAQNDIEPSNFDDLSIRIFYSFDSKGVLGLRANEKMAKELANLGIDPHGASLVLQQFANEITVMLNKANNAINSLQEIFGKSEEIPDGMHKLQIVFEGEVNVETFNALQEQSKDWEQILKVATQIFPDGYPSSKITKIYKASPAIIIVVAPVGIVTAIASAVFYALKIKEKMLDIKKLELDVEKQQLENTKAFLDMLKSEEKTKLDNHINEATTEILKKYKDKIGDQHIHIAEGATKVIIKELYNFTVKGGQVSLVDGSKDEEASEHEFKNLNKRFKEIKNKEKDLNFPKLLLTGISKEELEEINNKQKEADKKTTSKAKTSEK
jgi:hypothetical protein